MRTDDGCIVQECLSGDPGAFGILVDKYKAGIYAFVYDKLSNFQDAEDVTQEVFLKAYHNLRTLRRWESFGFWLYRIAQNQCKKWVRTQSRRPDRAFIEDQSPKILEKPSLDAHRGSQIHESLREALDSLSETYREVLVLHYFGGMTIKNIAKAIGASPTAIGVRLSRARAQLKEEMIAMMDTAFDGQRLQASFTFRIVEAVKRIKIHPIPRSAGLPWGLSMAAGIITAVLCLNSHMSTPHGTAISTGSLLRAESKALKAGEIPVEIMLQAQTIALGHVFPENPIGSLGPVGPKGGVISIVFNPDDKILASGHEDGTVRLWNVQEQEQIGLLQHGGLVSSVVFSPDGGILASVSDDGKVNLWDIQNKKQLGLMSHPNAQSVVFSPDGGMLASAGYDNTVRLWDVNGQKQVGLLMEHTAQAHCVAFSPDGKLLASGGWDDTIRFWGVQTQKQVGLLQGHTDGVISVAFSPDGKLLASGAGSSDKTIRLWDVERQEQVGLLQGHEARVCHVAFSPDGKLLASGSWDFTVCIWDVQEQRRIAVFERHNGEVLSVAFSPGGQWFASGSWDGTVLLWEMKLDIPDESVEPTEKQLGTWGKVKRTELFQNFPNP